LSHPELRRIREKYENREGLQAVYEAWDAQGVETKSTLLGLLPGDWSFDGKRVLDFGCGTGRTLRHFLSEAEAGEFWGADVDPAYVKETQDAFSPPVHAVQCQVDPPLGLDYGSFDLIWAISVFTHLTENSIPWLLELHRLLKPGALLIATYIGRWNSEYVAGEPWDEDRVGMNVLQHTQGWDRGGPTVFMSDWWVRAHWGRAFEIVTIIPEPHNMSWALLRKRDVELTIEDLARPADDPREYLAMRHNLEQVQRELEIAQAVCDKLLADVRGEYEDSLSWKVTQPLRSIAKALRARRPP
jgi:SAM-dependent methyltransferase